jgi:hypothetical protein
MKVWKILRNKELEENLKSNNCSFTEELFYLKNREKMLCGFICIGCYTAFFSKKTEQTLQRTRVVACAPSLAAELGVRPISVV